MSDFSISYLKGCLRSFFICFVVTLGEKMDNNQEEFGQLMGETARLWRMYLNEQLRPIGLSYAKWSAVLLLSQFENGVKQNELARLLSIENPTLARTLHDIEQDGWIKRIKDSSDKRAKIVIFTKDGRKKFDDAKLFLSKLRVDVLDGIDTTQLQASIDVLKIIFNNLGKLS